MEEQNKQTQPNLRKDLIILLLIIVYVIALLILHFNYDYVDYGYVDEDDIIIIASIIYLLIAAPIAFVTMRKSKSAISTKVEDEFPKNIVPQTETAEIQELPKPNTSTNAPVNDEQYAGTGIVGLEVYIQLCKIGGIVGIFIGGCLVLMCMGLGRLLYGLWGFYFMIGAICCYINIPFVKALITIVKAAKLYLDKNQK